MNNYIADPLSIKDIRMLTLKIREVLHLDTLDKKMFPIEEFLEFGMPTLEKDFHICILTKEEMGNIHGLACPNEKCIKIREDVYDRAISGCGRDRFTIAHEIGHYLLHNNSSVKLARLGENKTIEAYRNPEWQADTFAAELLMPITLIESKDPNRISKEFGVSITAATIRVKKIYKQ
ncbi:MULTISPECIES: ImmA/IrrE family metallo-endopeptidase [Clostridium]|uniref:ImmA/IrrE family metallo-endopeptidase n=1 Tax=Clostridium TaxID=1485 RepID=UPI000C08BC7B|nr:MULTISPECIES: ImmA/IrrE family metallo-endopeptidase [Clostridium]MDU4728008.1 ImmA/IrrE family metallo-endopeptidase [Clostridium sp.]